MKVLLGGAALPEGEDRGGLAQEQQRYAAAGCDGILAPAPPLGSEQADKEAAGLAALTLQAVPEGRTAGVLPPLARPLETGDPASLTMEEAVKLYARRAAVLRDAGVHLLAACAMTSLSEARAALLGARETHLPVFLTLTPGCALLPAVITLQALGAAAVGLDVLSPEDAAEQIEEALPHARVPLAARLCAWMADGKRRSPLQFGAAADPVLCAGAAVLLGGEGALPEHLAVLKGVIERFPTVAAPEVDTHAAAGEKEAFFLADDLEPSEPLPCDSNLSDAFIEAEEDYNVARVEVEGVEDIPVLLDAAEVCRLPIAVYCDDPLVLDAVLLRYPGRLLVDSLCEMETPLLEDIAAQYGAIVF